MPSERNAMLGRYRLCFLAERFCWALASAFPRVSVNLILAWGVYTHTWIICWSELDGFWSQKVLGALGVLLYVLCAVSYFRIISVGPGSPLDIPGFAVRSDDIESGVAAVPPDVAHNVTAKENGDMRYCNKCQCWKPDRTHHCRSCKRCVLRMDHHCPWFAICIGFNNHKLFIQFLIYVVLFCAVCFSSSLIVVLSFVADESRMATAFLALSWVFLVILSGVMGIAVTMFTGFTVYLLLQNKTTLESMEPVKYKTTVPAASYRYRLPPSSETLGNIFDLGWKKNWCEVMGYHVWEWLLPVIPQRKANGTSFPINHDLWEQVQQEALHEQDVYEQNERYKEHQRTMRHTRIRGLVQDIEMDEMDENRPLAEFGPV